MDICAVDQVGCEDPDPDEDMAAHILHELEQEHRRMSSSQRTKEEPRGLDQNSSQFNPHRHSGLSSNHGDQCGHGHAPQ